MAGGWIKMRGGLLQNNKLIGMARFLHDRRDFRDWLTPGGGGPMNGQLVSDDALRCVTAALLLRVWSAAREFGKFVGNDLFLEHIAVDDLDLMGGAPGIGEAMVFIGWAVEPEEGLGVTLPNFKEHNVPMTNAEKQSRYRDKGRYREAGKGGDAGVTETLPEVGNKTVTRVEKSREEKKEEKTVAAQPAASAASGPEPPKKPPPRNPKAAAFDPPPALDTAEAKSAWTRWLAYLAEKGKRYPSTVAKHGEIVAAMGAARACAAIDHSITRGWNEPIEPRADDARAPPGRGTFEEQLARVKGRIDAEANGGGGP